MASPASRAATNRTSKATMRSKANARPEVARPPQALYSGSQTIISNGRRPAARACGPTPSTTVEPSLCGRSLHGRNEVCEGHRGHRDAPEVPLLRDEGGRLHHRRVVGTVDERDDVVRSERGPRLENPAALGFPDLPRVR